MYMIFVYYICYQSFDPFDDISRIYNKVSKVIWIFKDILIYVHQGKCFVYLQLDYFQKQPNIHFGKLFNGHILETFNYSADA